ncbi:hypothetical protein Bbelb_317470 [Branchiostoma belcheri]|nr:hypothetical protein Bbelb_317470 [Branchiostoma belcheri]
MPKAKSKSRRSPRSSTRSSSTASDALAGGSKSRPTEEVDSSSSDSEDPTRNQDKTRRDPPRFLDIPPPSDKNLEQSHQAQILAAITRLEERQSSVDLRIQSLQSEIPDEKDKILDQAIGELTSRNRDIPWPTRLAVNIFHSNNALPFANKEEAQRWQKAVDEDRRRYSNKPSSSYRSNNRRTPYDSTASGATTSRNSNNQGNTQQPNPVNSNTQRGVPFMALTAAATKDVQEVACQETPFEEDESGEGQPGQAKHISGLQESVNNEDKAIKEFLQFYRTIVPNGTIPVKMHMLEDHVVPCIRQWGFGLGFLGEQGVEHVHALFNALARPTCTIPDPVARLKLTLTNHLIGMVADPVTSLGKRFHSREVYNRKLSL